MDLENTKLDVKTDEMNRDRDQVQIKKLTADIQTINDKELSLENYIEKYMPLQFQHQLSETLMEVLEKKSRVRFYEVNCLMTDALRDDILKDSGHPELKAKVLDLITKLRCERDVLQHAKDEFAKELPPPPEPYTPVYDENGKEILSLDNKGSIRVNHGVE